MHRRPRRETARGRRKTSLGVAFGFFAQEGVPGHWSRLFRRADLPQQRDRSLPPFLLAALRILRDRRTEWRELSLVPDTEVGALAGQIFNDGAETLARRVMERGV